MFQRKKWYFFHVLLNLMVYDLLKNIKKENWYNLNGVGNCRGLNMNCPPLAHVFAFLAGGNIWESNDTFGRWGLAWGRHVTGGKLWCWLAHPAALVVYTTTLQFSLPVSMMDMEATSSFCQLAMSLLSWWKAWPLLNYKANKSPFFLLHYISLSAVSQQEKE